jgi:hypothetical protein
VSTITQQESDAINNAITEHYDTQEDFESAHGLSHAVEIGGIVVYYDDSKVVAFYDYELERGSRV